MSSTQNGSSQEAPVANSSPPSRSPPPVLHASQQAFSVAPQASTSPPAPRPPAPPSTAAQSSNAAQHGSSNSSRPQLANSSPGIAAASLQAPRPPAPASGPSQHSSIGSNTLAASGSANSATSGSKRQNVAQTFATWKRRIPSSWLKLWSWELLSAILSLLCIGAVLGILAAMDGKSLDDWTLPISPNALVSVFITLSKSALLLIVAEGISQLKWIYFQQDKRRLYDLKLFDEASRGPWGSLMLIISVHRKAIVASIGALITIISMAMDPFAQQIIQYNTVQRNRTAAVASLRSARDNGLLASTRNTKKFVELMRL